MNIKNRVTGQYSSGNKDHLVDLPIFIFKDDGCWINYSPGLDLSGYGNTRKEAEESFSVALKEFMKYTVNKNTAMQALHDLGWTFSTLKKKIKRLQAPPVHEMLMRDEYLQQIFNEKDFRKENRKVALPVA